PGRAPGRDHAGRLGARAGHRDRVQRPRRRHGRRRRRGGALMLRVLVVDDHPVWRDGVRADLEASGRIEVVGEAADGGDAIELAAETMPDLVLMDLNLPTVSGADAIRRIIEQTPHVKVLVLSASAA